MLRIQETFRGTKLSVPFVCVLQVMAADAVSFFPFPERRKITPHLDIGNATILPCLGNRAKLLLLVSDVIYYAVLRKELK